MKSAPDGCMEGLFKVGATGGMAIAEGGTAPVAGRATRSFGYPEALLLSSLVALAIGVLRGIAFPHRWAATHMFFRYGELGLIKRGLVGSLMGALGVTGNQYNTFFAISLAIFLGLVAGLVALLLRGVRCRQAGAPIAGLVFATSTGPLYLACTMGYLEQLALLACLCLFLTRSFQRRFVMTSILFVLLLFVHEGTYLMYSPLAIAACLLARDFSWSRRQLALLVLQGALLSAIVYWLGNLTVTRAQALKLFRESQGLADIVLKRNAFEVLARSGSHNLTIMQRAFLNARHWQELSWGLLMALPSALFITRLSWQALQGAAVDPLRRTLVCLAPFSVLGMHMLAWDIHRWNAIMVTNCFVAHGFVVHACEAKDGEVAASAAAEEVGRGGSAWLKLATAGLLLSLLNMASSPPLIGGGSPEPFPFRKHWVYLAAVASGKRPFPRVKRNPAAVKTSAKAKAVPLHKAGRRPRRLSKGSPGASRIAPASLVSRVGVSRRSIVPALTRPKVQRTTAGR